MTWRPDTKGSPRHCLLPKSALLADIHGFFLLTSLFFGARIDCLNSLCAPECQANLISTSDLEGETSLTLRLPSQVPTSPFSLGPAPLIKISLWFFPKSSCPQSIEYR